ncbi:MAG: AraC family transcriptional regulator [Planctomycetota bacterium]
MDVLGGKPGPAREASMGFYEQAERHMSRGSPVGAVGLETDKPPIMEASRGRTLRYHAVMYILAGRGFFQDEGAARRAVSPGTVFYLYPGRWHWFDPDPGTVWTEYWVLFDGAEAERRFGNLLPAPSRPIHVIGRDDTLVEAYERLYEVWLYGSRGYGQYASFLLHKILMGFFLAVEQIDFPHLNDLVHRTRELIGRNLGAPEVNFWRFAAAQGMSYERFRKRFKAATGLGPKQYHLAAKVNRARQQLLSPNLSVKEIATALGFSDALYFSRLFKAKVGLSPQQYRDRHLSAPAAGREIG